MKLIAAAAAIGGLAPAASASFLPSSLRDFFNPEASSSARYVVNESGLTSLLEEPPSFVSQAESSGLTTDIVSLGSVTRMDYLTAQIETWASHRGVRHYWGFSELQDFDPECSAMSEEARSAVVDMCKATEAFKDPKIKSFSEEFYGLSEGNRVRSGDAGWVCAQRRVGRALGWLHSQYSGGKTDVPDYLMVVDDDTYVDLVDVMSYLEQEADKTEHAAAFARAGCVFQENEIIPFPIAYGGFGTILNKAAVQQLTEPVHCSGKGLNQAICEQIKADTVGEASVFQEGMSIFELFYKYSARKDFCMHSDWLLGYMFEYYLSHSQLDEGEHNLMGMKTYPSCGNITIATGAVRPCTQFSDTCHNQNPKDMEALAITSYAQSPRSYKSVPKMEMTELDAAMDVIEEREEVEGGINDLHLPNVLLVDSISSDVAEFLTSNGVCGPHGAVHFFDEEDNYNRGVISYAKSFEHCSGNSLIVDTTAETLMHAERVSELYKQTGSEVKLIAVVRESTPGEYGRHLDTWSHLFNRGQMLILSSSELHKFPQKSQWRIEQFLGKSFNGELESVSGGVVPFYSIQDLKDMRDEFYNFIGSSNGPWMEQNPFPRTDASKNVAFASVLGWNPNENQNKLYLDAMRVAVRSLKDAAADFVVLMMYHDDDAEALLTSEGAIVKHVVPMKHSLEISHFEPWFVNIALTKLRAFELTTYDRVQVIDVDAYMKSADKMEKLFESYPNVKLVAEGLGSDSPLRAGWMMIEPSIEDFSEMQQLLEHGVFTTKHGWGNLDLAVEYPGWAPAKPSNNWEFYGSQLEQGLLFHYFYAMPKSINPSLDDSELLTLLGDDTLLSLGFVHFYGNRKPWAQNVDDSVFPAHVEAAKKAWLNAIQDLNSTPAADHMSPLTAFGVSQYRRAQVLYTYEPTGAPVTSAPTSTPVTASPSAVGSVTPTPTSTPVTSNPSSAPVTLSPSSTPVTSNPSSAPVTSSPSSAPVTSNPSSAPVTSSPSSAPITSTPSTAPITPSPSTAPITSTPSTAPITPSPSSAPITSAPSSAPITSSPSTAPVTSSPSTAPITPSPSSAPVTSSPTVTPVSTIQMDSTLKWNTTCEAYATYDDLVAVAKIIEQSLIEDMPPQLSEGTALDLVHVYELCEVYLDHGGTPVVNNARRLQDVGVATTDIKVYQTVSKECITDCGDEIFYEADNALNDIVADGSLSNSIQDNSGGILEAVINPNDEPVDSGYVTVTASPTVTPGLPSSSPSSAPSRTPITLPPVTLPPTNIPTPPPTQCGAFGDPCTVVDGSPFGTCCGYVCSEDEFGMFVCGGGEDPGSYPPTSSPVSSPPTNPPTNRPTSFPTASKSSKQSKSAKATPSPVTPAPTPPPATPRPTAAKSAKDAKDSSKSSKVMGESGFSL